MSTPDISFLWGHEHFCEPDTKHLYNTEIQRIYDPALGFPKQLDELPDTFCSRCLQWFRELPTEGSGPRPPQQNGHTNGTE